MKVERAFPCCDMSRFLTTYSPSPSIMTMMAAAAGVLFKAGRTLFSHAAPQQF